MDKLEIKASFSVSDAGEITGIAWPFGSSDAAGDIIHKGAFAVSAALPILSEHNPNFVVGNWESVEETATGLEVKGRLFLDGVPRARDVHASIKSGRVTGLSIGFRAGETKARPGGGRDIYSLIVAEISVVARPSHPDARVLTIKSKEEHMPNDNAAPVADEVKTVAKLTERFDKLEAKFNRPSAANSNVPGADNDNIERKSLASFARTGSDLEMKAAAVSSDPDGGYLVLPTLESGIRKIARDVSPLRALASVITISTDSYEIIVDESEVKSGWVSETGERPETDGAKFHKVSIPVFESYAAPRVTQKLLDDATADLGAYLEGKIGDRFAQVEGSAFAVGTGVDCPRGFLTYDTAAAVDFTRDWGKFQHVPAGATAPTDVQLADALVKLSLTLRVPYRPNATWLMSRESAQRIRQIKDTAGRYVWQEGLQAGQPDRLCGFPIAYDDGLPNIASGNLPVAIADWSQAYQIVDRHGMRVIRDQLTAKPFTVFYAYKRVGGGAVDFNALKFLKIAAA